MSNSKPTNQRRFSGVVKSYGPAAFERFASAHICVLGIGGVGSWVVEALARSGVGTLTLVDLDVVAESNINRQLHALDETVGRDKIKVMFDRVGQINPQAKVFLVDEFVTVDNVEDLLGNQYSYVVDCIDNFRVKAALISVCKNANVPVITIGGAGGKIDPGLIECGDLSGTERDQLLAQTRKLLRQKYQFSRQLSDQFSVPAVYSTEQIQYPSADNENTTSASGLSCDSTIGSLTHVTGSFAFAAVAIVLRELSEQASKGD
jgi:tRNA A37 threonylcarbamoyladenosine dehydratase